MKTLALTCSAVWFAVTLHAQDKQSYIRQYHDIAVSEMHRTGIPASIKLSQAVLESSYGRSELAREAHNHFGIKCGRSWTGDGYHLKDDDRNGRGELVHSCFRVFSSPEESFVAHSDFLADPAKAHRYGDLFTLAPDDYKGWAHGLQKAGYATNPRYARLLINIIEEEKLYTYDAREKDPDLVTYARPNSGRSNRGSGSDVLRSYTVQFQNDIPYIIVNQQDDLKDIAKRVDVPARKLAKYNETVDSRKSTLDAGERIYLQPLKRKYHGSEKTHIVEPGETIEDIAHAYGVKSKVLRKRNNISDDCEPTPGSRLVLRGKQKNHISCASGDAQFVSAPPGTPGPSKNHAQTPVPSAVGNEQTEPRIVNQTVETASMTSAGLSDSFIQQALAVEYTVQPKDTLYRIASEHGLTVAELKRINSLSSDVIHPGQSLKVK